MPDQDTPDTPQDTGQDQTTPPVADKDQETPAGRNEPPKDAVSRAEHEALLQKVREDEKNKVYGKIEQAEEQLAELKKIVANKEATADDLARKLQEIEDQKLSDTERLQKQLREQETQITTLRSQMEKVAQDAADRIRNSELKAYRANKLQEEKITLTELVGGDSEQKIDESIKKAKDMEAKIYKRAEEKVRKDLAKDVPTPIAPDSQSPTGPLDGMDRRSVAKLSEDEYQKARSEAMKKAKESMARQR